MLPLQTELEEAAWAAEPPANRLSSGGFNLDV